MRASWRLVAATELAEVLIAITSIGKSLQLLFLFLLLLVLQLYFCEETLLLLCPTGEGAATGRKPQVSELPGEDELYYNVVCMY